MHIYMHGINIIKLASQTQNTYVYILIIKYKYTTFIHPSNPCILYKKKSKKNLGIGFGDRILGGSKILRKICAKIS